MKFSRIVFDLLAASVFLVGCDSGGGSSAKDLPPEQQDPNYGKSSGDKLKEMAGGPAGLNKPSGTTSTPKK
jgi:hypothetical protein